MSVTQGARGNIPRAAAIGLFTFAWYAMPDVVRRRGVRVVLKTAMTAGICYTVAPPRTAAEANGPDVVDELLHAANQKPGRAVAIAAVALATSVALTTLSEKKVFAWGERRRARGVAGAHTLPALALGALAAGAILVDPPEA